MNLRNSWMWSEACALLDEAERRHRRFFDLIAAPSSVPVWEPPADILADGREVHVMLAMPGARADDIRVELTPAGLVVETVVAPPAFAAGFEVVRLEIPYGRIRRRIELLPGTYSLLEHRFERGILFLRLKGPDL